MKIVAQFISISLIIIFLSSTVISQNSNRTIEAKRLVSGDQPAIDGLLDDKCWSNIKHADDFTEFQPQNGGKPSFDTRVKFSYNDEALYIGAEMMDNHPDSIFTDLSQRDDPGNADWFLIDISPSNDGQNGFKFAVTAAGVQLDAKIIDDNEDFNWDAVWFSTIGFTDSSWVVEMKIPWSAIRFPEIEKHSWDINMAREIRRYRELSSWSFIDKEKDGWLSQSGKINGIENIDPPIRLSLLPYASGYFEYFGENNSTAYNLNYGIDLKYGINESYTLDMTLIPDFGQVQSDDQIYNFSPFEVYYNEKRQFFTEGTEIFNKAGIFYSRRIGSEPNDFNRPYDILAPGDSVIENPDKTRLINATKISGRNSKGLALGFFNAMTALSEAIITDSLGNKEYITTQPFSNFNMLVFDQNLKNNSYFHLANTNVIQGDYVANVSATAIELKNREKSYSLNIAGAVSQKYNTGKTTELGHKYDLELRKINGNFRWEIEYEVKSDTYDPNDMGFMSVNNGNEIKGELQYLIFNPVWKILDLSTSLEYRYESLYKPREYKYQKVKYEVHSTWKNHLSTGGFFEAMLGENHDFYEAREWGRVFVQPAYSAFGLWISPDYRRKFLIDFRGGGWLASDNEQSGFWLNIGPRWKISQRMVMVYSLGFDNDISSNGYVKHLSDSLSTILFANRTINRVTNTINSSYIFNNKSFITLRVRHYWVTTEYNDYYSLNQDGSLDPYNYTNNEDFTFNIFNIDLLYSWNFAPGSFLTISWKNALYQHEKEKVESSLIKNWEGLFESPAANSFSLKLLFYLDYNTIRQRIKSKKTDAEK